MKVFSHVGEISSNYILQVLGELSLFYSIPSKVTVKAATYVELQVNRYYLIKWVLGMSLACVQGYLRFTYALFSSSKLRLFSRERRSFSSNA